MNQITPPVAATRPYSVTVHDTVIDDPWAWLRDPGYPDVKDKDVLAYLEAENAWFEARMASQQGRITALDKTRRHRALSACVCEVRPWIRGPAQHGPV